MISLPNSELRPGCTKLPKTKPRITQGFTSPANDVRDRCSRFESLTEKSWGTDVNWVHFHPPPLRMRGSLKKPTRMTWNIVVKGIPSYNLEFLSPVFWVESRSKGYITLEGACCTKMLGGNRYWHVFGIDSWANWCSLYRLTTLTQEYQAILMVTFLAWQKKRLFRWWIVTSKYGIKRWLWPGNGCFNWMLPNLYLGFRRWLFHQTSV